MAEGDIDQVSKLDISAGAVAPDAEEACLWTKLPKELQNKVLCHLPLQSLFQVRCVCKTWRYMILRRDFATMYDAMHSPDPPTPAIFYVASYSPRSIEWSVYDYTQSTWEKRTILPPHSHPRLGREDTSYSVHPVGGLLVFRFWKLGVSHWVVWNPLTNKWKKLPSSKNRTLKTTSVFVHAFVSNESSKRYKILFAHNPKYRTWGWPLFETCTRMVTEVFDSATGVWTQSESTLQSPLYSNDYYYDSERIHPPGVLSNGVIYFVSRTLRDYSSECVLFCYNIKTEQWRKEVTLDSCGSIFQWDDRLMAVHRLDEEVEDSWKKWVVYEWDLQTRRWMETGISVPGSVIFNCFEEVDAVDVTQTELVAEGNHLVVGAFRSESGSFTSAVYRKAEDCWTCSPNGRFIAQYRIEDSLIQFKPRLDWTP